MIEINLLPEELRKTEGTPPARLLSIILSIVVMGGLGAMISSYYLVKIPSIRNEIQSADVEIKNLTEKQKEVEVTRTDITNLKQKVAALDNLNQSRIRYGRLLNQLCNSMPDGVWFRTFTVGADSQPVTPGGGKRYQISLTGYTTAGTPLEMDKKLTELMNNLKREFSIAPEQRPENAGPDFGWSKFINARFDAPNLLGKALVDVMPTPTLDPKQRTVEIPKTGLDFQMTFSFEMPAPKT
jgi:Tfp pilus assembly protein PilN